MNFFFPLLTFFNLRRSSLPAEWTVYLVKLYSFFQYFFFFLWQASIKYVGPFEEMDKSGHLQSLVKNWDDTFSLKTVKVIMTTLWKQRYHNVNILWLCGLLVLKVTTLLTPSDILLHTMHLQYSQLSVWWGGGVSGGMHTQKTKWRSSLDYLRQIHPGWRCAAFPPVLISDDSYGGKVYSCLVISNVGVRDAQYA